MTLSDKFSEFLIFADLYIELMYFGIFGRLHSGLQNVLASLRVP